MTDEILVKIETVKQLKGKLSTEQIAKIVGLSVREVANILKEVV